MANNHPAGKKSGGNRGNGGKFTTRGASRGHSGSAAAKPPRRAPSSPVTPNRATGFAGGSRPYDYAQYELEPATPEYMARLFRDHAFSVDTRQLERFWLYYDLLRQHNARLDLTRIMGIEATVLKHFIDSAIILQWLQPVGPVLDIGSGPGFPGVPLAIMQPDIQFILGESRGKRVTFLEMVIDRLDLANCVIFPKSVREDSPLGADHGRPVGDVVTRALETIPPTLERVLPFMEAGRKVAFMKGPGCDEEIALAQERFAGVYVLADDVEYSLPKTDNQRRLVIFEKCAYE